MNGCPVPQHAVAVEAAVARVVADLPVVPGREPVPITEAVGRVLAAPVLAGRPLPAHDYAAMDGVAVRFADLAPEDRPTRLVISGRIAAGHPAAGTSEPGTAVRIFTGAKIPAGPDTVVRQEECSFDPDGTVTIAPGQRRGSHIRLKGEDIPAGRAVLAAGTTLTVDQIGLLSALGLDRVLVRPRVRVAVLSIGDELAAPGGPVPDGGIYECNRALLVALLAGAGHLAVDLGIAPDRRSEVAARIGAALADGVDAVVTSAGAAQGEEDHTAAAVAQLNGTIVATRLTSRPGQPVLLARFGRVPFLGLPGNPVAVALLGRLLVLPVLDFLAGGRATAPVRLPVRANFALTKPAARREFVLVTVRVAEDCLIADKLDRQGSGMIGALAEADGVVDLPSGIERVAPGDRVGFVPLRPWPSAG